MARKLSTYAFYFISFVLIDIFARFLYQQSWFGDSKLSKEINPIEIFTLIVSTGTTIWLGIFVAKKISQQRFDKEYIISDLKQIGEELELIDKTITAASRIELNNILQTLKRVELFNKRFENTAKIFKLSNYLNQNINQHHTELFNTITNVEGEELVLDEAIKIELNRICNDYILSTREMIYKINNC